MYEVPKPMPIPCCFPTHKLTHNGFPSEVRRVVSVRSRCRGKLSPQRSRQTAARRVVPRPDQFGQREPRDLQVLSKSGAPEVQCDLDYWCARREFACPVCVARDMRFIVAKYERIIHIARARAHPRSRACGRRAFIRASSQKIVHSRATICLSPRLARNPRRQSNSVFSELPHLVADVTDKPGSPSCTERSERQLAWARRLHTQANRGSGASGYRRLRKVVRAARLGEGLLDHTEARPTESQAGRASHSSLDYGEILDRCDGLAPSLEIPHELERHLPRFHIDVDRACKKADDHAARQFVQRERTEGQLPL